MKKKIREHIWGITIAIFLCIGACTVVFGKTQTIQCGLTSLFWAIAMFIFAYITKKKNEQELEIFDLESREILIDIGVNGVNSEYFGLYDYEKLEKMRAKRAKKLRKQLTGVIIIGIILTIAAFAILF